MHTRTMPVLSTATEGNKVDDVSSEAGESGLKGYRKRWTERSAPGQRNEKSLSECGSDFNADIDSLTPLAKQQKLHEFDRAVEIIDKTSDDLDDDKPFASSTSTAVNHRQERQALQNTDMKVFRFPWERGRLAKIFGDKPLVSVKTPQLKMGPNNCLRMGLSVSESGSLEAKPVFKRDDAVSSHAIFLDVVKAIVDKSELEDRDAKRQKALEAWWKLLSHSLVSSSIGLKVTVESTADTIHSCALEILDATFAVKSAGTLFRRLYAIQAFEDWSVEHRNKHWLPVSEYDVWTYVKWLQKTDAPATKAGSLVEALRFSWYLLGVEGANLAESSLRIKGVSSQMRSHKKPWRPADLLTVTEVKALHEILYDQGRPLGDRVLAGHALHLLYSRSRWSDLLLVSGMYMDPEEHFLEVATKAHKGARSAEMKTKLLPIVAPAFGVDNKNWAVVYLEVRRECNLSLPLDGYGPMMCAPSNSTATSWSKRALTSEEGSDFLRRALRAPKTAERRISTHSLKSTVMSWASKYGLSEYTRAVLARHTSKAATATAVYSRDLLSPILRELNLVLAAIRNGSFSPDMTRSGMLTPGALPCLGGTPLPEAGLPIATTPVPAGDKRLPEEPHGAASSPGSDWSFAQRNAEDMRVFGGASGYSPSEGAQSVLEDALTDTTEENSQQSTSSSECEDDEQEQHRDLLNRESDYVINQHSLVVHLVRAQGILQCGRKLTPSYVKVYELSGIRCSRCFDV